RYGVDLGEGHAGIGGGAGDDVVEMGDMSPCRELGDDTAIGGMLLELRTHDIGDDAPGARRVALDDRRCRFVAARLDTQYPHAACPAWWNGLSRPATRSGLQ